MNQGTSPGPLAPYRVLDLTTEKGYLCGKMLGDLGADVLKIEPPGGDPGRRLQPFYHDEVTPDNSLYFWAYNTSKRSVVVDLEGAPGRDVFKKLVATADFVVESFPVGYLDGLGIGYTSLNNLHPGIIWTSITPFGASGPYSSYKGGDIISLAMGGLLNMAGNAGRRPTVIGVPQACNQAGAQAAAATLIAHHYRELTGIGQHVEVSMQEAVLDALDWVQQYYDIQGISCKRGEETPGLKIPRTFFWPCKDGAVSWNWWVGHGWGRKNVPLVKWMAEEGKGGNLVDIQWEEKSLFKLSRAEVEGWEAQFAAFFATHTQAELVREAHKRGFLLYPVNTPKGIVENKQLAARRFFVQLDTPDGRGKVLYPGAPAKSTAPLWAVRRRPPKLGEHTAEVLDSRGATAAARQRAKGDKRLEQALAGLKVADFTWLLAGPIVSKYLAMFGATVVKVESHKRLDGIRMSGPFVGKPGINTSGYFANHNASKLSLSVDLNDPRGVAVARTLVAWADVMVENFTPGVMSKWGIDYEGARRLNPGIIMLSTSFQGQTGPEADRPGYASLLHALAGFDNLTGWPDLPPTDIATAYGDLIGVWYSIASVMAALEQKRRTGEGQHIDLAQLEAAVQFVAPAILEYTANGHEAARRGNQSRDVAPHGVYKCSGEDRWCAIVANTGDEWTALCRVMGKEPWLRDERFNSPENRLRNTAALDGLIDEWTSKHPAEEVMERLQKAGVPAGVVENARDLHNDPQLKHMQHFVRLEHPEMGLRTYDAPSFRLSKTPAQLRRAPLLGEHNEEVCCSLLDIPGEEFVSLLNDGVLD